MSFYTGFLTKLQALCFSLLLSLPTSHPCPKIIYQVRAESSTRASCFSLYAHLSVRPCSLSIICP